jgi:hypothetical protein
LIKRLDSVIVDLEQQVTPTLVVSHVSVLQMLIAYFRNSPVETCMDIEVPLHTVIKFTPARGGGWSETVHPLVLPTSGPDEVNDNHNNHMQTTGVSPPMSTKLEPKKKKFFWPFQSGEKGTPDSVLGTRRHRGRPIDLNE